MRTPVAHRTSLILPLAASAAVVGCPSLAAECFSHDNCGPGALCVENVCHRVCERNHDCPDDEFCNEVGICMPGANAADAATVEGPRSDFADDPGDREAAQDAAAGDAEADASSFSLPDGSLCSGDLECDSGHCECGDSACTPTRKICARDACDECAFATEGGAQCGGFLSDVVPCDDNELCTYDDACDGAGACTGSPIDCVDEPGVCQTRRACSGTASCTESWPPDGAPAGTCAVCDGAGGVVAPLDDEACGTITCGGRDTYLTVGDASPTGTNECVHRAYVDITTERCASAGECKAPNGEDCAVFNDTTVATCGACQYAAGACSSCTAYPDGTPCGDGLVCGSGQCVAAVYTECRLSSARHQRCSLWGSDNAAMDSLCSDELGGDWEIARLGRALSELSAEYLWDVLVQQGANHCLEDWCGMCHTGQYYRAFIADDTAKAARLWVTDSSEYLEWQTGGGGVTCEPARVSCEPGAELNCDCQYDANEDYLLCCQVGPALP